MAISTNPLLRNVRGHINKQIVVRQRNGKIILSAYPDMSHVQFSEAQKQNQGTFKKAVNFACSVKQSWILTAMFQSVYGKEVSIYKQAIKTFFENPQTPLNFYLDEKMQGSHLDGACTEPLLSMEEIIQIAEKHLKCIIVPNTRPRKSIKTRRHNPNHKLTRLIWAKRAVK